MKGIFFAIFLLLGFSKPALCDCPDVNVYCYSFTIDEVKPIPKTKRSFKTGSKWDWKQFLCKVIRGKKELLEQCLKYNPNTLSVAYPKGYIVFKPKYYIEKRKDVNPFQLSNWMSQLAKQYPKFSNAALKDIILPGTHDSATSDINYSSAYSPDSQKLLERIKLLRGSKKFNKIFTRWSKNQTLSIKQQLDKGIRYLDIRLCSKGAEVFTCHGKYSTDIKTVIKQVKDFTDKSNNEKEIIIIDLNHFYGMTRKHHQLITESLKESLGDKIADSMSYELNSPLQQLWDNKKQIIIIYHDTLTTQMNPDLWKPNAIVSIWPNKQKVEHLIENLENNLLNRSQQQFYVIQSILTHDTDEILKGVFLLWAPKSLQSYSLSYKQRIFDWLQYNEKKIRASGSIIIEDWTLGGALTNFAIQANINKYSD